MTGETHLDGNALGGLFWDLFGQEMTHHRGCCDHCGAVNPLGSVIVYRGAGDVLCCPACGATLMVLVASSVGYRVSFESLRWLAMSEVDDIGSPAYTPD